MKIILIMLGLLGLWAGFLLGISLIVILLGKVREGFYRGMDEMSDFYNSKGRYKDEHRNTNN